MPRDVDKKKTRKALRKLRKAAERAEAEGVELTDWEQEFVEGVDERLTKFGSAFNDLSKGGAEEALSSAQTEILRQLDKKSRGKSNGGFKTRKPLQAKKGFKPRPPVNRDISDDIEDFEPEPPESVKERSVPLIRALPNPEEPEKGSENSPETRIGTNRSPNKRPTFRVIEGGKTESS
ncbi:MAG: hypothetical protein CMK09_09970 [Ponticaulis sp.]|nr:hypothetical protein [Ponticaulis sp.]